MKRCFLLAIAAMLLFSATGLFAQESASDMAYWVSYWANPKPVIFGPEQGAFDASLRPVAFPWNDSDSPSNPDVLDANVQWLKDHPNVRFYIDGYASSRGEELYNVVLSGKRADWVKQYMVSKGIPEDRIVMSVGWGDLYPVCAEQNDDCWQHNRLVRFVYVPTTGA
jgi:peptidoglycan-associated lipoprotein